MDVYVLGEAPVTTTVYELGFSFGKVFKKLKRVFKKVGKSVGKVAKHAVTIAGNVVGGALGTAVYAADQYLNQYQNPSLSSPAPRRTVRPTGSSYVTIQGNSQLHNILPLLAIGAGALLLLKKR